MRNKLFIILAIIFLLHFLLRIYSYKGNYLIKFDEQYWQKRYDMSQWSTKPGCSNPDPHINPQTCLWDDNWEAKNKNADQTLIKKNILGDDGLYAYAGWKYVNGSDPTLLNAEMPPFGKYLIGMSIKLFGNQNFFALLSGIFALVAFYLFNTVIIKDKFLSFVPIGLFSLEPLFYTQLSTTFLDLLYLGLLFMTFYFALKKQYIYFGIFLGLMTATKASISTFALVIISVVTYVFFLHYFPKKKKINLREIKKCIYSLLISGIVFLLTYSVYFLKGKSIIDFLGVQKWIFNFYSQGAKGDLAAIWQVLFTGSYNTWYGTVERVNEWHIGWIVLFLIPAFEIFLLIKYKKVDESTLIIIWIIYYFIFLSFIPFWSRYLLLILPFMYNLFVWRIAASKTPSVKNVKKH